MPTPEEKARQNIDTLLKAAGWAVQDRKEMDLSASVGVAVREFPLKPGPVDYLLFIDRKAAGVIEAKPEGTTLSGVAEQSTRYIEGLPDNVPGYQRPLPFAYESTGVETFFRDVRDPDSRSRRVFAFHQPSTLKEWLSQEKTLRARLREMPVLPIIGLRDCQIEAITNLEESQSLSRPRALLQMATGSGKTYTAVSFSYRLIKFAKAKRILFLVDRNNLGRQTLTEFQQFTTPDDSRKFTELYNVQHLTSNKLDQVSKVCITTIQRLYSMLRGEAEFQEENEEQSSYETTENEQRSLDVAYNPLMPIETFDFIITDECHRSIYNLWRQVLEYFDGFLIGLTATPSKQTLGFFNQNLVTEYSHERAVADGVNVDFEVYPIITEITKKGSKVEAGLKIDKRDKTTRKTRWEKLDDELTYSANQLDRDVVAPDQIRTVIKTFKDRLYTEIFPGRTDVPKTLIFAKDDSHAEDIVHIAREEFGKGNDFCKKITYRTTGEKPEDLIASFRNSYNPRIAVTVDMISTGTDIKPLECLIFMRDVKSRVYFEQMKGRATRTISTDDFRAVTIDAHHKTHFVIIDAVGVCDSDKAETKPLERKRGVSFKQLLESIQYNRDEATISSLASRLARLDREIGEKDKRQIAEVADGKTLRDLVNDLLNAIDPDIQIESASQSFQTAQPTDEQIKQAAEQLMNKACAPFDKPKLRETLEDIKKRNEQIIDNLSKDTLISAGFDDQARDRARTVINTFKQFIEDNKSELTALQMIYSQPYGRRHLTYESIRQLAEAIEKPPYRLTQTALWQAYEQLEKSKVRGASPQKLLTDIVSLISFEIGEVDVLKPFTETVSEKFEKWVAEQEQAGRKFTAEQMEWLAMIKEHIATSLRIDMDDFEYAPFYEKGGAMRVYKVFGNELNNILNELNEVLAA